MRFFFIYFTLITSTSESRNTPDDKYIPQQMKLLIKAAATITQPYPPSGGEGR